jgi:hypothetical protein
MYWLANCFGKPDIWLYHAAKMLNGWHEAVYSTYETFEKSQEDKFLKPSKFQKFQQC